MPQARALRAHASARRPGFEVPLLSDYCRTARLTGLIIGFGGCTDDELDRALAALVRRARLSRLRRALGLVGGVRLGPLALDLAPQEVRRAPQQREDPAEHEHHRHHEARARSRRPGSPTRRGTPPPHRSSPASSRHATQSPSPIAARRSASGTSARLIITGVVSPSTIASRRQDRGAHAAPGRALLARRSRAGSPAAGAVARASPTVTTEPVTSTAPVPIDDAERLARPRRAPCASSMASARRGATLTRSWPKTSRATTASSAAGIARCGGVLGADDVGEVRLEGGQHPLDVLVGHHADDPDQRARRRRSPRAPRPRPRHRAGCARRRAGSSGCAG